MKLIVMVTLFVAATAAAQRVEQQKPQPLGRYPVKLMGPKVEDSGELVTERWLAIQFATGLAQVDLNQARPALEDMYGKISAPERAGHRFLIAGHADQRGSDAFNDRLSQARADAVRRILVERYGVPPERLVARGYGERHLLDPANHEPAWQVNRRVELWDLTEVPEPYRTWPPPPLELSLLYRDAQGRSGELMDGMTLRSGDGYRIGFRTAEGGIYVYILQQDARRTYLLYPPASGGGNPVVAGRHYWIAPEGWLRLDETPGEEMIVVLASRQPLGELEGAVSAMPAGRMISMLPQGGLRLMGPGGVRWDLNEAAIYRRVVRFWHR